SSTPRGAPWTRWWTRSSRSRKAGMGRTERDSSEEEEEARSVASGVVAVVGRPNVGKSTLVGRLAGRRGPIVGRTPGLTRDRLDVDATWQGRTFTLQDTGGLIEEALGPGGLEGLPGKVAEQAVGAIGGGGMPAIGLPGRPKVGKASLCNRLVGEERAIVHAEPGTTRDAIDTVMEFDGRRYRLVDTAGMRRRARTEGLAIPSAARTR